MSSVPSHTNNTGVQRAALYVRVSSKEQVEGYSLDAQRRAGRDFAKVRGYQLVADYADEGVSAHTDNIAKRPDFARMLADAEAGRFDIIVVHKMDRFARKLRTCLECLETLGRHRVGVVSVSEPNLDYSTPQGFLFLSMLGALAEWYSRNLAQETRKGWAERKQRGLYAGRLPFGAVKGADGVPVPDSTPFELNGGDTTNHAGLVLAFERAADGATDTEVAETLNAAGYRPTATARRARFTRDAVRELLQNRFYVGELPMGKRGADGWLSGAHEPIVPVELFDLVQRQRARRATNPNPHKVQHGAKVHALTGLVYCAECGEPMHQAGLPRLTCSGRRQGNGCHGRSVGESVIVDEVGSYLGGLTFPPDTRNRILQAHREAKPEFAERERQRQTIEAQLRRLGDLFVMGDLSKAEYEARRIQLRFELARLPEPEAHGRPETLANLERYLLDAGAAWAEAPAPERNQFARALFESVNVQDGHVVSVRPRRSSSRT